MKTGNYNDHYYITATLVFALLLLLPGFSSCKKYLNEKPNTSLVVPQSLEDMQAILDDAELMNLQRTSSLRESAADDYFLKATAYNQQREFERKLYIWQPFEYVFSNDWSLGYSSVYNSNFCLEGIAKIPLTVQNEVLWKNVKGSALFFRAYHLLNLAWTYSKAYDPVTASADLGIPLRKTADFNVEFPRASVEDSYSQIIADAKAAVEFLSDNPLHLMRPSKLAAYALIARTYLSMRVYDSAFKYADLSLKIKNTLIDYNSSSDVLGGNVPFKRFNTETIFYTEMNERVFPHSIYYGLVDTSLYAKYDANDMRKTLYFLPNGGYQQFKGNYTQSANLFFTGLATDEMYLIRAECSARKGNKDAALADLNALLEKRYKPPFIPVTSTTSIQALDIILNERRKELLFRGIRWSDIKRLNKEGANIILRRMINNQEYTLQPNANFFALPLPQDIIQQTNLPQNSY